MLVWPGGLRANQLDVQRDRDPACDLVLQGEQIARTAVEPLCPQMRVSVRVDQLGVDPDAVTRPPDAPFKQVTDAELAADLLRFDPLPLIGERGIARNYEHPLDPRQIGGQILGDPIREILLFGVVAEVGKGQHYDRQAWRDDGRRT